VGKTTAAQMIFDNWKGPKVFASADSPSPPNAEWIRWQWDKAMKSGVGALLIIDEVQKVPGWSEQIKALFDEQRGKGTIKVLLLGSSSLGLQRGMSESLAGRFELVRASHWTYRECQEAFGWDFDTYLRYGAYPGAADFVGDEERWRDYILHSIVEPVLGRDIISLKPVNKPALFRQTFELAVQHPAHIISLQKMLGQLQDRGNAATIKHYLELLQACFLVLPLQKYSGSTIQTRTSSPKIVVLNHALTNAYCSPKKLDEDSHWYGMFFESIMGAHLSQHPNVELFYWRMGSHEVDYVLKTPGQVVGIEIKSGVKKKAGGLVQFSKRYPEARCEVWDHERCLDFLINETL
jgi:predicted AAA+ superfamily ATPase